MKSINQFREDDQTIYSFLDEILVFCTRCRMCAHVLPRKTEQEHRLLYFSPRRVVCAACGYVEDWAGNGLAFSHDSDPVRDPYFGLILWLQTDCCGHTLWFYNIRHLLFIEGYIGADLREQPQDQVSPPGWNYGWHNSSLPNRLPEWMIVAKHREAVLKGIGRLREKYKSA